MKRLYNRILEAYKRPKYRNRFFVLGVAMIAVAVAADNHLRNTGAFSDPTGQIRTFSTSGEAQVNNPFFQSLGTNGRSCGSCHQASDAWSVTPKHIQERFEASDGLDPIFRTNDGANCPSADVTTLGARRKSYSM